MKPVSFQTASTPEQLKLTIRLIGKAIRSGAVYLPIRHLAARTATQAPPKNYLLQIKSIFDGITRKWWRYTYDPKEAEVLTLDGPRIYQLTLGGGKPNHSGYGDCDDITIAGGALLRSIGMDVQICTTAPPRSPFIFNHVFLRTKWPKGKKWLYFDPVLFPKQGLGAITKHERLAIWDLNGNLLTKQGKFPPRFDEVMALYGVDRAEERDNHPTGELGGSSMYGVKPTPYWGFASGGPSGGSSPSYSDFYDYTEQSGLFGEDEIVDESNPQHMAALQSDEVLPDFSRSGIVGFGCYSGLMGVINGDQTPYIMAEYDDTDEIGDTGLVRTKHFEMDPADIAHIQQYGVPQMGALALADDGEIYEYVQSPDGLGGFFKKLFRKAKKAVRRVRKRIKKGVRKLGKRIKKFVRRTAFGRFLWKVGSKIFKTAMKLVKPLLKMVGPIAKRIAPIAAFIPGIGPAVSAGLMLTGKVYDIAKKVGVVFDRFKKPIIKNKSQARAFASLLAKEGKRMGKGRAKRVVAQYRRKKGIGRRRGGRYRGVDGYGMISLGETYVDPNVNAYYRTPTQSGIGWV
jgi:hypothetical protein